MKAKPEDKDVQDEESSASDSDSTDYESALEDQAWMPHGRAADELLNWIDLEVDQALSEDDFKVEEEEEDYYLDDYDRQNKLYGGESVKKWFKKEYVERRRHGISSTDPNSTGQNSKVSSSPNGLEGI